jgi:ubiquinone/menaquinone biosynthesis C-methylase UbiE
MGKYLLNKLLYNHVIYSSIMNILGSSDFMPKFIRDYIKPNSGERILDIGCGPADILKFLPDDIEYIGIDFNEMYIKAAKKQYQNRGTFILGNVNNLSEYFNEFFDVVIIIGVIHHLSDNDAKHLIQCANNILREKGRLITLDNIDGDYIGLINKIALKLDRGNFIREEMSYTQLFAPFSKVKTHIKKAPMRVPYYL